MNTYQVDVTVHDAPKTAKSRGPVVLLTYFVKTDSDIDAMTHALNCARITQAKHPRKYKGATFTVKSENVKIWS